MPPKPHIRLNAAPTTEQYTYAAGGGNAEFARPQRDRAAHSATLKTQLQQVRADLIARRPEVQQDPDAAGVVLEFRSDPDFELLLDSLDNRSLGFQLLSNHLEGTTTVAAVYVPPRRMGHFLRLVDAYATRNTRPSKHAPSGNPRNRDLIESISEIKLAAVRAFWTDTPDLFPPRGHAVWWEVWLRVKRDAADDADLQAFQGASAEARFRVGHYVSRFAERAVLLCFGTIEMWEQHPDLMNLLAELRLAKEIPTDYVDLAPRDQRDFVQELRGRIQAPSNLAPSVCILDTGVLQAHPLLSVALDATDVQSVNPLWPAADQAGHGTQMAGLALYGCLTEAFTRNGPVILTHRLESVKILPPRGHQPNDPESYGPITQQAVARAEVQAPQRNRVVCMAVTADSRDNGSPSAWSASVDQLCSGELDDFRRLVIVSAGNARCLDDADYQYPLSNYAEAVQDPAQAWNALTVGAYTDRGSIRSPGWDGWQPLASPGTLCPTSTTSIPWTVGWPIKPDIVMEGGNWGRDAGGQLSTIDDLALLTTTYDPTGRLFALMRDTSASTALAARMAATIQNRYPDLWPETVRALMIHSAQWTPAMRGQFELERQAGRLRCLRCYGYGVPNLDRALWSVQNATTLVYQGDMQPYYKVGGEVKTKDMHLHALPWPVAVLRQLGKRDVTMRVTLSYFVEPNPGRRWVRPLRYASYGLRFDVKRPEEDLQAFRQRITRTAWDADEGRPTVQGANQEWALGDRLQTLGSAHSDWWTGSASQLADAGYVAVFPVTGWWRERSHLGKWDRRARYALVVSLTTADVNVDLYTPIAVAAGVPVQVNVEL